MRGTLRVRLRGYTVLGALRGFVQHTYLLHEGRNRGHIEEGIHIAGRTREDVFIGIVLEATH